METVKNAFAGFKKVKLEVLSISEVKGGFTGAAKFMLEFNNRKFFLKAADEKLQPVDAFLIESEAKIYSLLGKWKLTGVIFPKYEEFINVDDLRILVLEFLGDASWGGPWNEETIEFLDQGLNKLHTTKLDEDEKQELIALATEIRSHIGEKPKQDTKEAKEEKKRIFLETWNESLSGFMDSKGEVYFKGESDLPKRIMEEAEDKGPEVQKTLIMHDLNFANIGFTSKQVYFVDPIFVTMGDPLFDRTVVGVNILQQLQASITPELKKLIVNKFFQSKPILARLIGYYVISSHKQLDESQAAWQKFHQECAVIALEIFNEI